MNLPSINEAHAAGIIVLAAIGLLAVLGFLFRDIIT